MNLKLEFIALNNRYRIFNINTVVIFMVYYRKIQEDYKNYCLLIDEQKELSDKTIILDGRKKSRPEYKEKIVDAYSDVLPKDITLTVQQKDSEEKDFKFSLRCSSFCPMPFFRFDSVGPAHRNANLPIPIELQQIPTPHFHRFADDGYEIAYKTKHLLDAKSAKALEDIELCIHHFLQESNVTDDGLSLISSPGELPLDFDNTDPLEGVNFI